MVEDILNTLLHSQNLAIQILNVVASHSKIMVQKQILLLILSCITANKLVSAVTVYQLRVFARSLSARKCQVLRDNFSIDCIKPLR